MTLFSDATARVHERIKSAPVEEWLKSEARDDLRRLIEAHELMLAEREEKEAVVETRQSQPDKWDRAAWRHQALDFALRLGNGNAQAAVDDAKAFEAYLKGE